MGMEETGTESYVTGVSKAQTKQQRKLDVYNEVLRRLKEGEVQEALLPTFEDKLWNHFNRLPARYAIDVNVERAEDVLTHMKVLELAQDPENRPVISSRLVQVTAPLDENKSHFGDSTLAGEEEAQSKSTYFSRQSAHPPPAFGSSANLEALTLEDSIHDGNSAAKAFPRPLHEITFATVDVPKLLNTLTCMLSNLGLDIQEALAFSTNDGYSLDVFVVNGWHAEEVEQLEASLQHEIQMLGKQAWSKTPASPVLEIPQSGEETLPKHVQIPTDGTNEWEIDPRILKFGSKIASGSFGDLYRGTCCGQDVAIKVMKPERINVDMQREFAQEIYIMRKVRHKNVVQLIGACTKLPSLFIVTEFMSGGSLYDYLHKRKGSFRLPVLLRVAIDISKGMSYLHKNNIIHRDLKSANLLMDENEVVKVADFGVSRVQAHSGVMTAETGTYRWMAPEVIEHKPYDHKADVFSFGVVLWELITAKLPYEHLAPLQAAVGVVQKGLRPTIPKGTNPKLAELIERCWQQDPAARPDFSEIIEILQKIEVGDSERKDKQSGGFFSVLKRGH